jgi:hypothetical protein
LVNPAGKDYAKAFPGYIASVSDHFPLPADLENATIILNGLPFPEMEV